MKEKIKKIYNWEYFPFLICFIVLLCTFLCMNISGYGDDKWFSQSASEMSEFDFLHWRYETWSSRIIIEFIFFYFLKMGNICCSIFVSMLFVLLGVAISKTFILDKNDKNKVRIINWIILFLLLTISYIVLTGAGVIATVVNYLFPVTFGIFVLLYIRKSVLKEKIKKYEYPLYIISALIATNMEQMCAILFVVCIFSLIYFIIKEKKINIFILVLFIISVLGLVNILTCPGVDLRNESEIKTWYQDYVNFGIVEKVKCGIYVVIKDCFETINIPYIIFSLIIAIEILKKYRNIFVKIISIIPVLAGTVFTIFAPISSAIIPNVFGINNTIIAGFNAQTTRFLFFAPYISILLSFFSYSFKIFKVLSVEASSETNNLKSLNVWFKIESNCFLKYNLPLYVGIKTFIFSIFYSIP